MAEEGQQEHEDQPLVRERHGIEGQPVTRDKHPIVRMFAVGTIASLVGIAICLALDWFPEQGSTAAAPIDRLYDVLLIFSVPIFMLVMTVAIYSVFKFRARPGDKRDGAPIHGSARLEVVWVVVPFVIVSMLAAYAWIVLDDIEAKQPNPMQVNVRGQQFAWNFEYPPEAGGGKRVASSELVLPVGRPVEFNVEALDVVHSFWVPAFRLKTDAVPGITTELRLTPHRPGRYDVVCAELCGIGHSTMRQNVRVVPEPEFRAFLAKGGKGGTRAAGQSPADDSRDNLEGG